MLWQVEVGGYGEAPLGWKIITNVVTVLFWCFAMFMMRVYWP